MIVFANEPVAYREAMAAGFSARTGRPSAVTDRAHLERTVRDVGPEAAVMSGSSEEARRLSGRTAVVLLSYEADEWLTVYRQGRTVVRRPLEGFGDLVEVLVGVESVPRSA